MPLFRAWTSGVVFVVAVLLGASLFTLGRHVPALADAVRTVPLLMVAVFGVATLVLTLLARKLRHDAKAHRQRFEALRRSEPGEPG